MLILSRKRNEQILIGDGIVLTVVSVRGNKVRIGIEAPLTVKVYRREMLLPSPETENSPASSAASHGPDSQPPTA